MSSDRDHRTSSRAGRAALRRPRGDGGNALVEFTYLSVLLVVPVVYVLLTAFQVQRAAFAVTEAARQSGRAYATADSTSAGMSRATLASDLALADQGLPSEGPPEVSCSAACLSPGSTVTTRVRSVVVLPVLGLVLPEAMDPTIPVSATHVEVVDTFQAGAR